MRVISIDKVSVITEVFNFTIDKDNNFYAGHGTPVLTHNCDQANANAFSKFLNRINYRRGVGFTATVKRRDGLHAVLNAVLGKVVAKGTAVSTLPSLVLFETGIQCPRKHKTWNGIVNFLMNSKERNTIIMRQIFKDLRANKRHRILVPAVRVAHVLELVKLINQQAAYNNKYKNENWPSELAVAYYGKSDTNEVLNQINKGKVRVVVSNTRMVQRGLDVPRWTHVYIGVIPTSNDALTWQLANRVCTPYPPELEERLGPKPPAVARIIIDPMAASVFCFAKVFLAKDYGYKAGIEGNNLLGVKTYSVDRAQLSRMIAIATYPKSYSPADAGVKSIFGEDKYGRKKHKETWTPQKRITRF